MAHTPKSLAGSKFYTVTIDSSIDWDSRDVFPGGMRVVAIEMAPAAINDAVVVRDVGADTSVEDGPRIFSHEAIDTYDIALRPYRQGAPKGSIGQLMYPYIIASESTGAYDITFELG